MSVDHLSASSLSFLSCSSRSRCSRASRRFSVSSLVASSGSVVPAEGLVLAGDGKGAEGAEGTAGAAAGAARKQHSVFQMGHKACSTYLYST